MSKVRIIEINEDISSINDTIANRTRQKLSERNIFFMNVMSSPGSGKTTTLVALINKLKGNYRIGHMDVDIETALDAKRVSDATGIKSLQIHNGGLCHIDADMTAKAIKDYGIDDTDILILENIGNLVCPAEFDTGAHKNVMILSVPEGDDKPLKYPLMFSVSDVVLINKIDTMDYFDFDMEKAKERILKLNPNAKIIPISAKTSEGMDEFVSWVEEEKAKIGV